MFRMAFHGKYGNVWNALMSVPEVSPNSYNTDFPAYSNTDYSDTPLTVTVLTGPTCTFIYQK